MLFAIARAEFRYQITSPVSYLTFAVFFGIAFLLTANSGEFESFAPGGTVFANSPFMIARRMVAFSIFITLAIPAIVAPAVLRDRSSGFDGILFATPIAARDYLLGRFIGAFSILVFAFIGGPLGLFLGTFWPWTDASLLGPTKPHDYVVAVTAIAIPSLLAISALIFAVAVTTRSLLACYLVTIALLALYLITGEADLLPPVLDPYGFEVFDAVTRYWTAAERNTQMPALEGDLAISRLLWVGVGLGSLLLCLALFSFRAPTRSSLHKPRSKSASTRAASQVKQVRPQGSEERDGDVLARSLRDSIDHPWNRHTVWLQFAHRTRFEVGAVLRSVPFVVLMLMSCVILIIGLNERELMYGVQALPLTRWMLPMQGEFKLILLAVVAFYSADIVWRERTAGIDGIVDATPASNAVLVASKLTALVALVVGIMVLGIVIAIALQLFEGYFTIDIALYLERGVAYPGIAYFCLAVLAIFFQVLSRHRYFGHLLFALFIAGIVVSRDLLGWDHPLLSYVFPDVAAPLSDMNGSGRFAAKGYWLRAYWTSLAVILILATYFLHQRGPDQPLMMRIKALSAMRQRGFALATALALASFIGTAGFIFFNTNVLNDYRTDAEIEQMRADYERRFRQFESLPMPRVTGVSLNVDLYPDQTRLDVSAALELENKTARPLAAVHAVFPPTLKVVSADIDNATGKSLQTELLEYRAFDLNPPMEPGEKRVLAYRASLEYEGFTHDSPDTRLVANGTFLTHGHLQPTVGFEPDYMLDDDRTREQYGLDALPRRPPLEDVSQHTINPARVDSDFLTFEATISTSEDQTAFAPGRLEASWLEGDRRFFHYVVDAPIRNFYGVMSGRYAVVKDQWRDVGIEVHHHPGHGANVPRMIRAIKDSLEYYTTAFGPYPFSETRVVEFPSYREFTAQAFPGLIAFDEDRGFLADVQSDDIDIPYYVTAHEMAHQWWGHTVSAANTQGAGFIHETLAQYSALRVMEERYGSHKVRQFLKKELDLYLAGRADDPQGEMPLFRVEGQPYIHYRKGAVVLYAIADLVGVEPVDRALNKLVRLRGFRSDPYALSTDLLKLLTEEIPAQHHGILEDFLQRIALVDLKVRESSVDRDEKAGFSVNVSVSANKLYAAADGTETEASMDWPVEIGVFARHPDDPEFVPEDVLYLERHDIASGESNVLISVSRQPTYAGIDPFNKLIDRDSNDNVKEVGDAYAN